MNEFRGLRRARGGFPEFETIEPPPAFGRFVEAMRRAQDLAVSAAPDASIWEQAAQQVEDLVALLAPHQAAEGLGPAGRSPKLPAAGSLLMPPWQMRKFSDHGVEVGVEFSRYHVGGGNAVHGGVLPLMFDSVFGMVLHATDRPISRTAFLHVDYRKVTPIDVPLTARGWLAKVEGRKAFVNADLIDPDGTLLAESHGLMVSLLPGQP